MCKKVLYITKMVLCLRWFINQSVAKVAIKSKCR